MTTTPSLDMMICIPVYNDWESVTVLLGQLDQVVEEMGISASVLLVDDRSSVKAPQTFGDFTYLGNVEILRLRRNLGHQRAIAVGLTYAFQHRPSETVVVMDGDGEDSPEDIKTLYQTCSEHDFEKAVFAKRGRRSEGIAFKVGYNLYKVLAYALTGFKAEVGNFSILPRNILSGVMCISEIWNHYAAALIAAKVPFEKVTIGRASRIAGKSKMNMTFLVCHGLRAISVYEQVSVRLLFVNVALLLVMMLKALPYLLPAASRPEWVSFLALLGLVNLGVSILLVFSVIFLTLKGITNSNFVPLRDYQHYVDRVI